jgi:hypothetical protein
MISNKSSKISLALGMSLFLLASCGVSNSSKAVSSTPAASSASVSSTASVDPAVFFNLFQASGTTFYEQDDFGLTSSAVNASADIEMKQGSSTSSSAAGLAKAAASSVASSSSASSTSSATYNSASFYLDNVYFDARFNGAKSTTGSDLGVAVDFVNPSKTKIRDQGKLGVSGVGTLGSIETPFVPRAYLKENVGYLDLSQNATLRVVLNAIVQGISGDSSWLFPQDLKGYKALSTDQMDALQPLSKKLALGPAVYAEVFKSAYSAAPAAFNFANGDTKQFVFSSTDNATITKVAIATIEAELTEMSAEQKSQFEDTVTKVLASAKWTTFSFGWSFNEKTWLSRSINVEGTFDKAKQVEVLGADAPVYVDSLSLSTKISYISGNDALISFPADLNKTAYTEIPDVKINSSAGSSTSVPTSSSAQ